MTPTCAVAPVFILPMVILAMLAAALLAWLLAALRRWWAFLNVFIACSALYVVRFTFQGVCRRLDATDAWWARPAAFWAGVTVLSAAGAVWYWRRPGPVTKPSGVEKLDLSLLGAVCLGVTAAVLSDGGRLPDPLLVACATTWAGAAYALMGSRWAPARLTTPGVMLGAMALTCAAVGVASGLAE